MFSAAERRWSRPNDELMSRSYNTSSPAPVKLADWAFTVTQTRKNVEIKQRFCSQLARFYCVFLSLTSLIFL